MTNESPDEFVERALQQIQQISEGSRRKFDRRFAGGYDQSSPQPSKTMTDLTRQEVDAKLAQNKAEVEARLANFDTSVKTGFAELKVEIQKMRGDFERQSHDSTKWIIGSVFGMISLAVAVIGVMINLNKADKPAAAPTAQPAPIIITVPATTQPPAPAPQK